MRCIWFTAVCMLVSMQLVQGQKELAGAYIEGNDWCPEAAKPSTPPPSPQRSSSLGRLFGSSSKQTTPQPQPAAACTPSRLCGSIATVLQRCKATAGCKAVSYDGKCGVLKKASEPRRQRRGWSTYVVA